MGRKERGGSGGGRGWEWGAGGRKGEGAGEEEDGSDVREEGKGREWGRKRMGGMCGRKERGGSGGGREREGGVGVEGKRMLSVMMECVKDKKGKGNHGEVKKKEGANRRQVRDRDDLEVRNDSRRASRWDSTL